jgi:LPS-assembly lipoprotein
MPTLSIFSSALRYVRVGALLGLWLALSGCGFHLQGAGSLPPAMARTYVDSTRPHSDFLLILTDGLRQRGSDVLAAPNDTAALLDITADETGQRVLSVSARNIPREYEVYYSVTFSLTIGGQRVINDETLVVTRSYTYDETQVLAKAAEEEVLRHSLAEDLARRVVRRIEAIDTTAVVPTG